VVARVATVAFQGIDVLPVDVQVQVAGGLPAFTIVGLPDKAVGESRERVRAALSAIGLALPPRRITVNLSPADGAHNVWTAERPCSKNQTEGRAIDRVGGFLRRADRQGPAPLSHLRHNPSLRPDPTMCVILQRPFAA
jgi:hypothetical protein